MPIDEQRSSRGVDPLGAKDSEVRWLSEPTSPFLRLPSGLRTLSGPPHVAMLLLQPR